MPVTYAKVNISNFLHNLSSVRKLTGRKICMAAKADCYGHGTDVLVKAGADAGLLDAAGVADISEAVIMRELGIRIPILVFRGCLEEDLHKLAEYDIQPFVSDIAYIRAVEKCAEEAGKKIPVHLKIDSGMSRAGCSPSEALELARYIKESSSLVLEGICSHLAVSDSFTPECVADTKKQIRIFNEALEKIRSAGISPSVVHCAASGAILAYPETYYDMVRPGILLYGYPPGRECCGRLELKPVMDFISHVILVKRIKKGEKVSYGFTWQAMEDTTVAVIGAGYADGFNRLLSNQGRVSINGVAYPVVGRVCMDQFMVNLGDNPENVKAGDEAVLFGNGENAMDAFDAADICNTISYELLCNINKRVTRIYIE